MKTSHVAVGKRGLTPNYKWFILNNLDISSLLYLRDLQLV